MTASSSVHTPTSIDLSQWSSTDPIRNRLARASWRIVYTLLFRPSPRIFHGWRRLLLRWFGAKIGRGVRCYPTAKIWAPWHLEMGDFSCMGPDVDCYSVAPIRIGANVMISQYAYLSAASHDIRRSDLRLVTAPIEIGDGASVEADAFVGMGVKIGEGAVVGARSSVFKDVEPWTIVGGNPARVLKKRELNKESDEIPSEQLGSWRFTSNIAYDG